MRGAARRCERLGHENRRCKGSGAICARARPLEPPTLAVEFSPVCLASLFVPKTLCSLLGCRRRRHHPISSPCERKSYKPSRRKEREREKEAEATSARERASQQSTWRATSRRCCVSALMAVVCFNCLCGCSSRSAGDGQTKARQSCKCAQRRARQKRPTAKMILFLCWSPRSPLSNVGPRQLEPIGRAGRKLEACTANTMVIARKRRRSRS